MGHNSSESPNPSRSQRLLTTPPPVHRRQHTGFALNTGPPAAARAVFQRCRCPSMAVARLRKSSFFTRSWLFPPMRRLPSAIRCLSPGPFCGTQSLVNQAAGRWSFPPPAHHIVVNG